MIKQVVPDSILTILLVGCGDSKTTDTKPSSSPSAVPPTIPLETAAFTGNVEAISQHIAAGTDLNAKRAADGNTALITAATFDHAVATKALIEGGADVNLQNNDGSTPLMTAAFLCREDVVKVLLEAGADKSIRNTAGSTALESVRAPWEAVKPIYDFIDNALAPAGLSLDFERIKTDRPKIVALLE